MFIIDSNIKKVTLKSLTFVTFLCLKVPPDSLVDHSVPVMRCVQSSREFVVVFSGAYHCNISCGYTLSESVHYASQSWIPLGYQAAKVILSIHNVGMVSKLSGMYYCHVAFFSGSVDGPRHEETCLWGLRPGKTKTGLHSHRS